MMSKSESHHTRKGRISKVKERKKRSIYANQASKQEEEESCMNDEVELSSADPVSI